MLAPKMKEGNVRNRLTPVTVAMLVVLILYVLSLVLTLGWAVLTSFKSQSEFFYNIVDFPEEWVWNYTFVFRMFYVNVATDTGTEAVGMGFMFLYACLYALGCAFTNTLIPCLTSYLCARFKFRFGKVIYTIVIVAMILPIVGNLPSEIRVAKAFGLYDQIWGLWIMKANFLGMYFLVFYATFKGLPMAYTEAAKIDGANNMRILLRIVLPLAKNTFFTVMLINFIAFWNDYQTPLIYLPSYPTIALGMYHMASTTENGMSYVPMRMTGAVLMMIPIMVLFMLFHKRLLGNVTVGGIKG